MQHKNSITNNPGTEESAVTDMILLSKCNELALSFESSFGFSAAGFGGIHYYVIMPKMSMHDLSYIYFWGSATSEPGMYASRWLNDTGPSMRRAFNSNPLSTHLSQYHGYSNKSESCCK